MVLLDEFIDHRGKRGGELIMAGGARFGDELVQRRLSRRGIGSRMHLRTAARIGLRSRGCGRGTAFGITSLEGGKGEKHAGEGEKREDRFHGTNVPTPEKMISPRVAESTPSFARFPTPDARRVL